MKPEKLETQSLEGSSINLEALYAIAPSCFTEVRDERTGKIKRVVDFQKLRTLLGDNAVETAHEMYQFTWAGKSNALFEANRETTQTLRPVPKDSLDWDTTENLYIEGENLEVLKLLQKSYMGKVKMIYIDPPYNTGNDFVYHDNFTRSAKDEDLAAGNIDSDGKRYCKNTDSNGRFHSDWCSMIYSRLLVAQTLLAADGVIFISIDDNEVHNLRKICDEVFGARNFVDIFNWAKTETPENLSKKSKQIIEYVLCYQKNITPFKFKGIKKEATSSNGLLNQPNKMKTLVFPANVVKTSIPNGIIPSGSYGTDAYDVKLLEDTEVKDGFFIRPVALEAKFKWSQENLEEEIKRGTTIRIPTMNFSPSYEKAEYDAEVPANLINSKVGVLTNETAGTYQESLFGKKIFNFPKPTSLIEYLLGFNEDDEQALVMDFFSGSASTADAVMRMNAVRGENKFKYILVQIQEDLELSLEKANESTKQIIQNAIDFCDEEQLPHNICSIGRERIRRAGEKIKEENPEVAASLDTGFRLFRLDSGNYEEVSKAPREYSQGILEFLIDNIKSDRDDLDLLFGAMLSWGVSLSLSQPIETEEVDGCKIYSVTNGELVACFAKHVTEAVVMAIAAKHPERVLFRDSCFDEDKTKINLFELLKQQLDWNEKEALDNIRVI